MTLSTNEPVFEKQTEWLSGTDNRVKLLSLSSHENFAKNIQGKKRKDA